MIAAYLREANLQAVAAQLDRSLERRLQVAASRPGSRAALRAAIRAGDWPEAERLAVLLGLAPAAGLPIEAPVSGSVAPGGPAGGMAPGAGTSAISSGGIPGAAGATGSATAAAAAAAAIPQAGPPADEHQPPLPELLAALELAPPSSFLLYTLLRQQFLELVDLGEPSRALALLTHRIKPLWPPGPAPAYCAHRFHPDDFRELCRVLTCASVAEAPYLADWPGVTGGRDRIIVLFSPDLVDEVATGQLLGHWGKWADDELAPPPARLVTLLKRGVAFRLQQHQYSPSDVCQTSSRGYSQS
ncbi:hypothetical protein H696_04745 [Fonticula alba]|uniref:CTLH domain-containing protein n=1 Tax=Fonticula alba TaxID=691883 RepID=A0A058Z2W0_FONAL|nr:hypothetical protein H696_04745 [Fonticula alba]KCV68451.1 hypothetical protein H696_04745 [Fonticula alba]|eukprot:XP_009496883.1 hypothetical protein H696_04745 [Fonticula alba]